MATKIILQEEVDLSNCTFISGFHGIGLAGFIAVKHLIKKLKAKRIGFLESRLLPPFISIDVDNNIITPFEFFKYNNCIFFLTEFPPYEKEMYTLSKVLADWIVNNKFSKAILIGGLDKRFKHSEEISCKFIMTSAFKKAGFIAKELPILDSGLHAFGLLALLLARFEIRNFPALAILPYADASRPDPLAASVAIDFLNKFLGLNVDTSELIRDAERIEQEIKAIQQLAKKLKAPHEKTLYM